MYIENRKVTRQTNEDERTRKGREYTTKTTR